MSGVLAIAAVRAVLVEGGSPELEVELRTNELTVCSAPCDAKAIVRCASEGECVVEIAGKKRVFSALTRDDRVRLAEAVRAALLELLPGEEPAPKPPNNPGATPTTTSAQPSASTPTGVRPPPEVAHVRRNTLRSFELSVMPSVVWQGGTPGLDLAGRVTWFPSRMLGLNLEGTLPIALGFVHGPEGTTSLGSSSLASSLTIRLIDDVLRLRVSVGLAASNIVVSGSAESGFVGKRETKWSALSFARIESGINLGDHWYIPVSAAVGVGLPPAEIAFADRVVRQWAAPMLRLETGVGFAW